MDLCGFWFYFNVIDVCEIGINIGICERKVSLKGIVLFYYMKYYLSRYFREWMFEGILNYFFEIVLKVKLFN